MTRNLCRPILTSNFMMDVKGKTGHRNVYTKLEGVKWMVK
jgi:hypothetical protein